MNAKPGPIAIRLRSWDDENRQPWIEARAFPEEVKLGPPYLVPSPQGVFESLYAGFPACLPYLVTGLKQEWAFARRSLIAGEMIFVTLDLGQLLMMGRDRNDMSRVLAVMILIVALGYIVDGLLFKTMERRLQYRWGLTPAA